MAEGKSVFISYSSRDSWFIDGITKILEQMGISYWKAPEMIPPGSNYAREIPKAIRECRMFLLIMSKASQESIWVEKEIDSAIGYRKSIVPLKIDSEPLNDMFQFYLNNVQMIPYYEDAEKAEQMLRSLLIPLLDEADRGEAVEKKEEVTAESTGRSKASGRDVAEKAEQRNGNMPEPGGQTRAEPAADGTETARRGQRDMFRVGTKTRPEGLTMNRSPVECQYCGGKLKKISRGTYRCQECGRENYDYFQTVRNYLDRFGATPALTIERDTGVPRKVIEYFLRQEYLEIPKHSPIRMACEKCGAPIRTGYLCEQCKKKETGSAKYGEPGAWRSTRR